MKITMKPTTIWEIYMFLGSLFSKHLFHANPSWANHSKTRKSKSKLGFASHSRKQQITAGLPSNERCLKKGAEGESWYAFKKGEVWRAPNPGPLNGTIVYIFSIWMVHFDGTCIGKYTNSIGCLGENSFKCHQGCQNPISFEAFFGCVSVNSGSGFLGIEADIGIDIQNLNVWKEMPFTNHHLGSGFK